MRTQDSAQDFGFSRSLDGAELTLSDAGDIPACELRRSAVLRWDESSLVQLEKILVALCESRRAEIMHPSDDATGADELAPDGIERMEQLCELAQDESELGEVRRALLQVRAQTCNVIATSALHYESRTSWAIEDQLHAAEFRSNEAHTRQAGKKIPVRL